MVMITWVVEDENDLIKKLKKYAITTGETYLRQLELTARFKTNNIIINQESARLCNLWVINGYLDVQNKKKHYHLTNINDVIKHIINKNNKTDEKNKETNCESNDENDKIEIITKKQKKNLKKQKKKQKN